MNFLLEYQLDIMMFMCGMCGILAVMTLLAGSLPRKTKIILTSMEISAMLLLLFDRFSYIFRGDTSTLGFWMVRVGNGMVYLMSLVIPFFVTRYLEDIYININEAKVKSTPKMLVAADVVFAVGVVLVIVSQFTGLYYTFDAENNYQRAPLNMLCYAAPLIMVVLQEWSIIKHYKKIKRSLANSMIVFIALPMLSSVLQFFFYGVSIINMVTALVVCVFFSYALNYISEAAERAKEHELEFYKEAQKKEAAMFVQTTEALANAIDAKDRYTRGHSTRVALYAKKIAEKEGFDEKECDHIYFAGLLHDIGKIGIRYEIINKPGRLTDDEFDRIKAHSELGNKILSSIKQAPFLSVGAHYHHERYDGTGYPDGLKGEEIPQIARIISVADAYDAMTSIRSYREPLKKEKVREELKKGMGTQFDPEYARAMLEIMDEE